MHRWSWQGWPEVARPRDGRLLLSHSPMRRPLWGLPDKAAPPLIAIAVVRLIDCRPPRAGPVRDFGGYPSALRPAEAVLPPKAVGGSTSSPLTPLLVARLGKRRLLLLGALPGDIRDAREPIVRVRGGQRSNGRPLGGQVTGVMVPLSRRPARGAHVIGHVGKPPHRAARSVVQGGGRRVAAVLAVQPPPQVGAPLGE